MSASFDFYIQPYKNTYLIKTLVLFSDTSVRMAEWSKDQYTLCKFRSFIKQIANITSLHSLYPNKTKIGLKFLLT